MPFDLSDVPCPICGKWELYCNDLVYECRNCGVHEVFCGDGKVWTHVPLPIGLIKRVDKK